MAQNDVWRFSMIGSHLGTELAIITFHFRETSGIAETGTVFSTLKTGLLTSLAGYQANTFRWDMERAITVNTTPKKSEEYTSGFPIVGSGNISDELPHQVAQVVTLKTAYAGRSYRGRVYLPALQESQTTNGAFTSGHAATIQGFFDTMIGVFGAAGSDTNWRLVVWSTKLQAANNVVSAVVRTNPGVIRRRRIGVGQ